MAAVNGKVSGATPPPLSSLQAALRKAPSVAKSVVPKQGGQAVVQGVKRSLSAEEAKSDAPPQKKLIVKSPAQPVTAAKSTNTGMIAKTPVSGKAPTPVTLPKTTTAGAIPKVPSTGALPKVAGSAASPKAAIADADTPITKPVGNGSVSSTKSGSTGTLGAGSSTSSTKSATSVTLVKAKVGGLAPKATPSLLPPVVATCKAAVGVVLPKRPATLENSTAIAQSREEALPVKAITELVAAIEAAPTGAKVRSVVRLADIMGQNLQIEHLNCFLRTLKKKVIERAQQDGVRVAPAGSTALVKAASGAPAAAGALSAAGSRVQATTSSTTTAAGVGGGVARVVPSAGSVPTATAVVGPDSKLAAKAPGSAGQPQRAKEPASAPSLKPPQPSPQRQPPKTPPSASPPPDAAAEGGGDEAFRALLGELAANPVCQSGVLNETHLGEILKRLFDGAARKPQDWIRAWQAMSISIDKQTEALQKFLNMAFVQAVEADTAPMVMAELVKAHKVKMRSVEEILVAFGHNLEDILTINENAWHAYAHFLVHVFPKASGSGWGWSRVGWSWQSWWKYAEQCMQSLDPSRAFDVLVLILQKVQEREGQQLAELSAWTEGDKLQRIVAKVGELCACDHGAAVEKLGAQGLNVNI